MGATGVQVCTAAMHHGYRIVEDMIEGLNNYLDEKGIASVMDLVGKAVPKYSDWGDLDLTYTTVARINNDVCINCNKCHIACEDTSHQCIDMLKDENGNSILKVREEDCVGCNLCSIVCPVEGAIDMVEVQSGLAPMTWNERQRALGAVLVKLTLSQIEIPNFKNMRGKMMKKIIKNGIVVTSSDTYRADVYIENGIITQIGVNLSVAGAEVIDARGCYLFPGGIDPHTHLDMPFGGTVTKDDYETGTIAAAFGGTTTIIDFCLTKKGETLKSAIETWHGKAKDKAVIDYSFHLQIAEMNEEKLNELPKVIEDEGITSLKVFMAYKNQLQADDETLFRTLVAAKEHGALVMVHAENGDVIDYLVKKAIQEGNTTPIYHALTRPPEAEGEATGRAATLTGLARFTALCCPCHLC